jgi:hypothetical protein
MQKGKAAREQGGNAAKKQQAIREQVGNETREKKGEGDVHNIYVMNALPCD